MYSILDPCFKKSRKSNLSPKGKNSDKYLNEQIFFHFPMWSFCMSVLPMYLILTANVLTNLIGQKYIRLEVASEDVLSDFSVL